MNSTEVSSFEQLGLAPPLCVACSNMGWTQPTPIQSLILSSLLGQDNDRDIIGIAQTGSGKTGAFVLPILHHLLQLETTQTSAKKRISTIGAVLVLVPTRELAAQVAGQFTALGQSIKLRTALLVGGRDAVAQALQLSQRPHVLVATPGRLSDHLCHTKGFHLHNVRWLIMDEADKMLELDYEQDIRDIVAQLPHRRSSQRCTMLFSATLSARVDRLRQATLYDPEVLQVSRDLLETPSQLSEYYLFCPEAQKLTHLHLLLIQESSRRQYVMVFCASQVDVVRINGALRILGHNARPLMGRMSQREREASLEAFRCHSSPDTLPEMLESTTPNRPHQQRILVCTDVAQRGLDLPEVGLVVNYPPLPREEKAYVHRVGRTARAGRDGVAVAMVTPGDIAQLQRIEQAVRRGVPMPEYSIESNKVDEVLQRVTDAVAEAARQETQLQRKAELLEKERRELTSRIPKRRRSAKNDDPQFGDRRKVFGSVGRERMRRANVEHYGGRTAKDRIGQLRQYQR